MSLLSQPKSSLFQTANSSLAKVESISDLRECTHLAIGAHPDDLEIMASHGIEQCYQNTDQQFVGVTCTNGGGSARTGRYKDYTDEEMREVRRKEQMKSAALGEYQAISLLEYESSQIKSQWNKEFLEDLKKIISQLKPDFIYTHNLADKHATHIGVCFHVIEALKQLEYVPKNFFGCEVWRGLDWVSDDNKIPLPIYNPSLVERLIGCHESQTEGGKRYAEATLGRMQANSTFFESHTIDECTHTWYAMDLMPLLINQSLKVSDFINKHLLRLVNDVHGHLRNFEPKD